MNNILLLFSMFLLPSCDMNDKDNLIIPIVKAVENGWLDLVESELKKGIDANTTDSNKKSLLLIATRNNDVKMAELLLKYKADVNQQDNIKDSPFLYAGASGYTELIKLYLKSGAKFDVFNRYNGSALIPACERGHIETVKILANTKSFPINHINRLGWTALLEAVILGDGSTKYQEIVRILIDAGADASIADHDGITPLKHSRKKGFTEITAILEKAEGKS